jgi:hypothetical protein
VPCVTFLPLSPPAPHPSRVIYRLTATMIVLRLVLGLAALGLLHSVLFAPVPIGARERTRRDRR